MPFHGSALPVRRSPRWGWAVAWMAALFLVVSPLEALARTRGADAGPARVEVSPDPDGRLIPAEKTKARGRASEEDKIVGKFVGKNWVNGKSWAKLEYAGKLGYVCGLFDGFTVYYSMADGTVGLKKTQLAGVYKELSVPSHLTVGDVVNGMDEFYQDPLNMRLPAICAYLYFIRVQRGEKEDRLRKRLESWRVMFTEE